MRLTKDKMKYTAVIKYNGQYYVSHKLGSNKKFRFMPYETSYDDDFSNDNVKLRKRIAKQLTESSPFKNTYYTSENCYKAVLLYRKRWLSIKRVAIFVCNELDISDKSFEIPYCSVLKHECEEDTNKIITWLKWQKIIPPLIMYFPYFLLFFISAFYSKETAVDLDLVGFLGIIINYIGGIVVKTKIYYQKIKSKFQFISSKPYFDCLSEMLIFIASFGIAYCLRDIPINQDMLTKLATAFLFWDAMARLVHMEQ